MGKWRKIKLVIYLIYEQNKCDIYDKLKILRINFDINN